MKYDEIIVKLDDLEGLINQLDEGRDSIITKLKNIGSWDGTIDDCSLSQISSHIKQKCNVYYRSQYDELSTFSQMSSYYGIKMINYSPGHVNHAYTLNNIPYYPLVQFDYNPESTVMKQYTQWRHNHDGRGIFDTWTFATAAYSYIMDESKKIAFIGNITDKSYKYGNYQLSSIAQLIAVDPKFSRSGKTFVNWNTLLNGEGQTYDANYVFDNLISDLTVYAQWI